LQLVVWRAAGSTQIRVTPGTIGIPLGQVGGARWRGVGGACQIKRRAETGQEYTTHRGVYPQCLKIINVAVPQTFHRIVKL
jgi:hypothetical protein